MLNIGSNSQYDDIQPERILSSPSLKGIADYIQTHNVKRIVLMTGAGISTSAGIPDFRTAGTGLYSLLGGYNLPEPEDIFDLSYFQENPYPFYKLAAELLPGKFRPTIAHSFVKLLEDKGLLSMCFTQNIDTLERAAGVSDERLIEAHGSFNGQNCGLCRELQSAEKRIELLDGISNGRPVRCEHDGCDGFVKPSIVFFGEPLPRSFHERMNIAEQADLVIIMGTSLSVYPFAGLPQLVPPNIPRLLINMQLVGDIGARPNDVTVLTDCDSGVRMLAQECGWIDDLEALWAQTQPTIPEKGPVTTVADKDELVASEIHSLSGDVDRILAFEEALRKLLAESDDDDPVHYPEEGSQVSSDGEIDNLVMKSSTLSMNDNCPL